MVKRELLTKTLRHYCDLIWEYDLNKNKLFIHYDRIIPECENRWYGVEEIASLVKNEYLFEVDRPAWEKYLNKDYLLSLFDSNVEETEFFLRFKIHRSEIKWYTILIDRPDDHSLIISGKNKYDDIRERSLHKSAKKAFDNVINIDVETQSCVVNYSSEMSGFGDFYQNYDEMTEWFVRKYAVPEEVESLIHNLKFSRVLDALDGGNDEYVQYASVYDKNGKIAYKKLSFSYLDNDRRIVTFAIIDISDLANRYEHRLRQLKRETFRDALTGAYNRNYYEINWKTKNITGGVALIDMDDFKLCNDTYGHDVGDMALISVTEIIKKYISNDDILIRYGGDEFLLLMPKVSEDEFYKKLSKIQSKTYSSSLDGYPKVRMSVSVGGVTAKGEAVEKYVELADGNMYQAKNSKNMVVTEKTGLRNSGDVNTVFDKEKMKRIVLIVDDSQMNRAILSEMLQSEFRILEASNGEECIDMINQYGTGISIILLDIIMPVSDGFEVLEYMNKNHYIEDIPVVMISSDDSDSYIKRAYGLGVSDYINRPFDSKVVYRRVLNTITLYAKQRRLVSIVTSQSREKEKYNQMMVNILSQIVEFRNGESAMHVLHINSLTEMLLERLIQKNDKYQLSWQDRSLIIIASSLHDIGKIAIDSAILNKPGELTDDEFEIMKTHTVIGESILNNLEMYKDEPLVKTAAQICRWHHERYDGKGYPDGLKGEEIPIGAQVVALADVYDALISKRVYKKAFSHETAVKMILNGECGSFNPILIECLKDISDHLSQGAAAIEKI